MKKINLYRVKISTVRLFILLLAIFILGSFFLLLIGNDQLAKVEPSFQFFADSGTYIRAFENGIGGTNDQLVAVDRNYLGPHLILSLARDNNYLVLLINVAIFGVSCVASSAALGINPLWAAVLLLISPLTISTLLSVNKEIFIFPFFAFAILAFKNNSFLSAIAALLLSIAVRWQLTLVYLIILFIYRLPWFARNRVPTILLILTVISLIYPYSRAVFEPILLYSELSIDTYSEAGSRIFDMLINLQNNGLYIFIFPLKAFHLLFAMVFKFDRLFSPVNLYNDFFVGWHCLVTLIITLTTFARKSASCNSEILFASLIYMCIICVSPVYAPRYLYPMYISIIYFYLSGAPRSGRNCQT